MVDVPSYSCNVRVTEGVITTNCNPNRMDVTHMAQRVIPDYPETGQAPKIITCTNGMEVLIDAEDYPLLSRHGWYINWSEEKPYAITKLKTDQSTIWRCIFMHHLILGTAVQIDHKDGNPLNNQKHNLRPATHQQNGWNTRKRMVTCTGKPPTSIYKGVSKVFSAKLGFHWRVQVKLTKKGEKPAKFLRLGPYFSEEEAAVAYNREIVKHRPGFAWLNDVVASVSKDGKSE